MESSSSITSNVRQEIQKIDYLPPMPAVAQEILIASNDNSSSLEDIAEIIKKDPALTAKIIGIANSAYFSFPRKVISLDEAIINVLGLDLVKGFALTIAMSGVFDPGKCPSFDVKRYWCSAFLTAELASNLSEFYSDANTLRSDECYVFGLLHNIGILILADRFPNIMNGLFQEAIKDKEKHLIDYEKETIDFNHHEAGSWLAKQWKLPGVIADVIEHMHEKEYAGNHREAVLLVGFCSRIARSWQLQTRYEFTVDKHCLTVLKLEETKIKSYLEKAFSKLEDIESLVESMTS
ncbi:MAG: HDOD domain-containing protein [Pseudomonadota bacterium]